MIEKQSCVNVFTLYDPTTAAPSNLLDRQFDAMSTNKRVPQHK
jgi:hypothetical protein